MPRKLASLVEFQECALHFAKQVSAMGMSRCVAIPFVVGVAGVDAMLCQAARPNAARAQS